MRVLVVSDIHGNRAALDAVAATPHDAVICLGDIVGYGPEPLACVDWVREHAMWAVQGNHDRAIGEDIPPRCRPDFAWLAEAVTPHTRRELAPADLDYLAGLPRWAVHELDGLRVALFHARPSDPLYGYMPDNRSAWARELASTDADLVLVGHTHLPLDFQFDDVRLLNPGSVGQPKDGDPRAAFALIENGVPSLRRVEYPVEQTVASLGAADAPPRAVEVLAAMLRAGTAPLAA